MLEARPRVFIAGATGLVGSALHSRLLTLGYEVLAAGHQTRNHKPAGQWVSIDLGRMLDAEQWLPLLKGVDAVVNCAGLLQDGGGDATNPVHHSGPAALFAACERAGVRRVI